MSFEPNTTPIDADTKAFYDNKVVTHIVEKYGFSEQTALESYLASETYRMFCRPDLEMTDISPLGIFDMWEVEQVTGDPRNSLYVGRDERV